MPGALDPTYIAARRVLLDALHALRDHRKALILVGAHAVYVHAGDTGLATAPFTADGDLAIDVLGIGNQPRLADAMAAAAFVASDQPGRWIGREGIPIDLLVPAALAGPGKRGARLGVHGNRAARKVRGLEAALVDRAPHTIRALEESDPRVVELDVAGPAALLVAKLCKIAERLDEDAIGRVSGKLRATDKDALDVLRLLRTADLMAARTAALMEDPATVAVSCAALAQELLATLAMRPGGVTASARYLPATSPNTGRAPRRCWIEPRDPTPGPLRYRTGAATGNRRHRMLGTPNVIRDLDSGSPLEIVAGTGAPITP